VPESTLHLKCAHQSPTTRHKRAQLSAINFVLGLWGKVSNHNVSPKLLPVCVTNEKLTMCCSEEHFDQIDVALGQIGYTFLAI